MNASPICNGYLSIQMFKRCIDIYIITRYCSSKYILCFIVVYVGKCISDV